MIRAIKIAGLRGIREGQLDDFTPLVVLVGPNSSGKSTVLDALLLGATASANEELARVMARRPDLENRSNWLLNRHQGREANEARIEIRGEAHQTRVASLTHVGNHQKNPLAISTILVSSQPQEAQSGTRVLFASPPVASPPLDDVPQVQLLDPDNTAKQPNVADLYTRVAERGLRREAKGIITDLLPDLEDIEILSQDNKPVLYLQYKSGALPLALAGDGVRLLLRLSLELAAPVGGVVLLEEPEVHMHPGAIRQVAKAILAAVARGIQVIMTTHSLELIDSLLAETSAEDLYKLSFYRLQLNDGILKSSRLSGADAALARSQIEDDLR